MAVLLVFIRSGHSNYDVTSIFTGKGAMLKLFPVWGAGVFTLHGISYCMDIYRKEIEPEKNFLLVSQYISFMPSASFPEVMTGFLSCSLISENLSIGPPLCRQKRT